MSTTIDQRVVEMRFDNKQFEQNVSTTMSTLDKLKQKLNFGGASKGLESVNAAAKGVNLSGLSSSVEAVSAKFSAMQVIGVTALANITNSAVNAGKRMVAALTIDPIKTGFQEYETQINSVQTILANTKSKGSDIEDVNRALEELNKYADMTIYNFTEMTRNIGTFTAAGIDLDTSVTAIQGIANLAAVSGSTSQQASTAMYQLSQALASGTVKLMDWNSVVNAGMGGEVFQNALRQTSEELQTGAEAAIKAEGSFRESLSTGWLTADVLTRTLKKFTTSGANEYLAEYTGLSTEAVAAEVELARSTYGEAKAIEYASKALAKKSNKNADEIKSVLEFAQTATDAATKVKTFTQLWDVLKETAQSGWSQTWKIIVGDFEEAKGLLTPLADFLQGVIDSFSKFRNNILQSALGRTLNEAFDGVNNAVTAIISPMNKAAGAIQDAVGTIADLGAIVDEVILGKFGNGQERIDALTKAGVNYYEVQNKVNEKLGNSYRYTEDQISQQNKLLGVQTKAAEVAEKQGEGADKQAEATVKLTDEQKKQLKTMAKMVDETGELNREQLKAAGYNDLQIEALQTLKDLAEDLGVPFEEFIDNLDQINGRFLLINGFKNIGKGLVDVGRAIGKAWMDVFPEHKIENFADKLFNLVTGFSRLTSAITNVFYVAKEDENGKVFYELTEAGDKLIRTLKGVFAIIDIIGTVVGGAFKTGFKIVTELLGRFDVDLLSITATIGDAIVGFRDMLDGIINVSGAVDILVPLIKGAASIIRELINAVRNSKWFADFCEYLNNAATGLSNLFDSIPDMSSFQNLIKVLQNARKAISDWIETLKTSEDIPADIISGLVQGITGGAPKILAAVFELAKSIISGICEVLGIHSPSTVMITIGGFIIAGLVKGINDNGGDVMAAFTDLFSMISEKIVTLVKGLWDFLADEQGNIDFGKLFAGGAIGAMIWGLVTFAKAVDGFADAIGGFGDLLENAGDVLKKFGKVLSSYSWDLKAKALLKLAGSIAILVAAVVVLTQIDDIGKLWNAVGIITVLAIVLVGLAVAMDKMTSATASIDKDGAKFEGLKTGLLQIALAMVLLAGVVKVIGDMEPEKAQRGMKSLLALAAGLLVFVAVISKLSKNAKDLGQFSSLMLKLSIAMMLMVGVIKLVSGLSGEEVFYGIIFVTAFAVFVRAVTSIAKTAGNNVNKVGGLMIKLAFAMGLMVGVVKLASMLSLGELAKGTLFAAGFVIFLKSLVQCTKIGKKQQIAKLGGLVVGVAFALTLMVGVCKLVGLLTLGDIIKGTIFVAGFMVMLKILVGILSVGNETTMMKVAGTIFAMSVAIGILAGVCALLGLVPVENLAKGVTAVGVLGLVMAAMIKALKGANEVKGSIMMMAIAIGVMAAALVALTFIDDTSKLMAATAALGILMGMFALIAKNSKEINKAIGGLIVMTVVVGLLAGVLYMLANNVSNADMAVASAVSLGILMAAMAATLKIVASIKTVSWSALGAMGVMVAILAGIALVLGVLTALDVAPSLETAIALSTLLIALAAVTAVLSVIGIGAYAAIGGIAAFAVVVAGVGALMLALAGLNALFPDLQTWLDTGIDILQKIGEGIGRFIGGFIGGIGEGLMDSLLDMVDTFILVMQKLAVAGMIGGTITVGNFDAVIKLIGIIADIGALTVGTTFADIFTIGGTSMEKFQTDGVAFFKAMKAIGEASTGVTVDNAAMDAVIGVAQKLADLQSSIEPIGGVVDWFTGRDDLATFGANIGEFISSMKTALSSLTGIEFDPVAFGAIVMSAGMLADLQGKLEPMDGVVQWFSGHSDLSTFGENIVVFINAMKSALGGLARFPFSPGAFEVVMDAAKELADLQSKLEPMDGVIQWFSGHSDLSTFGINVAAFIESMKTALGGLAGTTLDEEAMSAVINAAGDLAKLQDKLEPMGGVVQWFAGRTDLATFGTNIAAFGAAMASFKTSLGEAGIDESVVTSTVNAGNAIIELQKALPEEGWFDGKMDLGEFSGYVTDFAAAMSSFSASASEIDTAATTTAIDTAKRIKTLIESLAGLDTSGLTVFTGIGTGGFGADGAAYKIAQTMSKYGEEVAGINVSAVSTSVTAATKLKSLISGLVGLDTSGIKNFKVDSIATSIKNYGASVASIDLSAVTQSVSAANKLKTFISSLAGIDTSGVGAFKSALEKLSTVDLDSVVKTFSGASVKMVTSGSKLIDGLTKGMQARLPQVKNVTSRLVNVFDTEIKNKLNTFETAGSTIATKIASGLGKKKTVLKSSITACITTALSGIRLYYINFYNAGSYLVDGFASGISANSYKAAAKSKAMAEAAVKAAREALAINSPSKVFRAIGMSVPEGFAQGITRNATQVAGAVETMSGVAVDSLSSTVSRIAAAIDSDMDVQPTIRPVLDLSNIRSGSGLIGDMLGVGSSVGVLANVGAISNAMNHRGQSASNDDVVSAINGLRKELGNVGNTTYSINGITYDDGSNIATAVRDLTRYARMERRV